MFMRNYYKRSTCFTTSACASCTCVFYFFSLTILPTYFGHAIWSLLLLMTFSIAGPVYRHWEMSTILHCNQSKSHKVSDSNYSFCLAISYGACVVSASKLFQRFWPPWQNNYGRNNLESTVLVEFRS